MPHHFTTTLMRPRSIVGVPFDSARRFRASLLLHTTCDRSWCNWSDSCVTQLWRQNTKTKNKNSESAQGPNSGHLITTRMRSQRLGVVSGVAALQTIKQGWCCFPLKRLSCSSPDLLAGVYMLYYLRLGSVQTLSEFGSASLLVWLV